MAELSPGRYTDRVMEKIRRPSGHTAGSLKKGGKSAGAAVPETVKKGPSSHTSPAARRPSFFLLRREKTAAILHMLALHRNPSGTNLLPLRSFLHLLQGHQPVPGSRDLLLGERFLRGWLEKYGEELPREIHKAVSRLARLLEGEHRALQDRSQVLYYMDGAGQNQSRESFWSLSVQEKQKDPPSGREDEIPGCLLEVTSPRLGDVRVLLQYKKHSNLCTFFSSSREIRQTIRRSLSDLLKQTADSGFRPLRVRVGKREEPFHSIEKEDPKGVDLWQ